MLKLIFLVFYCLMDIQLIDKVYSYYECCCFYKFWLFMWSFDFFLFLSKEYLIGVQSDIYNYEVYYYYIF